MKKITQAWWFPFLALVVIIMILISGCGAGLTSGEVIGKDYKPMTTSIVMVGKILEPIIIPEEWSLELKNGDQTDWIDVDEDTYDSTPIGAWYQETK